MNNEQDILIDDDRPVANNEPGSLNKTMNDDQKMQILIALKQNMGHQTYAAQQLGISRVTLWRRMKKFEMNNKQDILIDDDKPAANNELGSLRKTMNDNQKIQTLIALKQNMDHRIHTAQQLGISRVTLWRRMKKFEI